MTVTFPEGTKAQGNISVRVVQTIADPEAPKLATEVNAVTSVDVSCFLYGGGIGTSTQNKGEAPKRICATDTFQQFGNTTYEVSDLQYAYDPQQALTAAVNKARQILEPGTEVWLVVRLGLAAQTEEWDEGQFVDLWHVRLGRQNKTTTGDGEFDELSITQGVIVLRAPVEDVALVA